MQCVYHTSFLNKQPMEIVVAVQFHSANKESAPCLAPRVLVASRRISGRYLPSGELPLPLPSASFQLLQIPFSLLVRGIQVFLTFVNVSRPICSFSSINLSEKERGSICIQRFYPECLNSGILLMLLRNRSSSSKFHTLAS